LDLSWKYSSKHRPAAPVLPVNLANFPLEVVVDTGFGGGILIPFPLFESLGFLTGLTVEEYRLVLPDSRRLMLYTAKEKVGVAEAFVHTEVHASPSIDRRLAGRSFLRSFVATLDGGREELKLQSPMAR